LYYWSHKNLCIRSIIKPYLWKEELIKKQIEGAASKFDANYAKEYKEFWLRNMEEFED
jgi:hypothetical protein